MLRQPCPALRSTSSPPKYAILDEAGFEIVLVEINQVHPQPVLHLTLAKIVQIRLPVPVLGQIFRYMPGIAAIHDALRGIDTSTGQIGAAGNIDHSADRPAMDAHAQAQAIKKSWEQNLDTAERARGGSYCRSIAEVSSLQSQGRLYSST